MNMDDIGFYTLTEKRCRGASPFSPIERAEFVVTKDCNFRCPYCRGLDPRFYDRMTPADFEGLISMVSHRGLVNCRISGGEPTAHKDIIDIVSIARSRAVGKVAVSTNGSADWGVYRDMIRAGGDDFSVSLDACCSAGCKTMSGGIDAYDKIIDNIRRMSELVYTTVGVVLDDKNENEVSGIVATASFLKVSDIRVIPAAQYSSALSRLESDYGGPIFRYRKTRSEKGLPVRGITTSGPHRCLLAIDDVAIMGDFHYPCIIYMRERGLPIGKMGPGWRNDRVEWMLSHDPHKDDICRRNCLDVCVDHNKRSEEINKWWKDYQKILSLGQGGETEAL